MRFTEYLAEASSQYGIIISKSKNGEFEDIDLYDMANDKLVTGKGHIQDLFDAFVSSLRKNDAWKKAETFVKKKAMGKRLRDDYDDDKNFINTLYGPINSTKMGQLSDDVDEMYKDD